MRLRDNTPPTLTHPILVDGSLAGAHFMWDDAGKGAWIVRADLHAHPKVQSWMAANAERGAQQCQAFPALEFENIAREAVYH